MKIRWEKNSTIQREDTHTKKNTKKRNVDKTKKKRWKKKLKKSYCAMFSLNVV